MPMILNEEQNMLKDTAKAFCGTNAPISQLRKLRDEDNADGFDAARGEDGGTRLVRHSVAGEYGGLAFGYKGLGVVTEETGRTLAASLDQHRLGVRYRHQPRGFAGSSRNCSGASQAVNSSSRWRWKSHRHDPYHIETKAREKKASTRSAARRRSCSTATWPTN
jgi:hypothetical protein